MTSYFAYPKPTKPVKYELPESYFTQLFAHHANSEAAEFEGSTFLNFIGEIFQFMPEELIDVYAGKISDNESVQDDYKEIWKEICGENGILWGTGFGSGAENVDFYATNATIFEGYDTTHDGQSYEDRGPGELLWRCD